MNRACGFLLGPYERVKSELSRPGFVSNLLRLRIQVVDHEDRVHGSGTPDHKFTFKSGRLSTTSETCVVGKRAAR